MHLNLFALQNVPSKAGTPGVVHEAAPAGAPAGGAAQPQGGGIMMMLPILMIVPFLFLMFRRQKKEAAQRASLKRGDRIVSQSGLIGELVDMDDRIAKVKIAPGTTVQMLLSTISPIEVDAKGDAKKADDLKDLKDAKAAAEKK